MNTKCCVYRGCGNTSSTTKITFFGFPVKDILKCNTWATRAGCNDLNLKRSFLCENHFSHIYISRTARRTILLPNAVPFHYEDQENKLDDHESLMVNLKDDINHDNSYGDASDDLLYTNVDIVAANNVYVNDVEPSGTKLDEEFIITAKTADDETDKIDEIADNKLNVNRYGNNEYKHVTKRQKLQTSANSYVTPKQSIESKISIESQEIDADADGDIDADADDDGEDDDENNPIDNTINNPDITTFIYKGEEYIQMPKQIYIEQRRKLDADLKRCRKILQNIKRMVNNVE